jgi:hypothetical protein
MGAMTDANGTRFAEDRNEFKAVVVVVGDSLGFEFPGVCALEKEDVVRRKPLLEADSGEKTRGRLEVPKAALKSCGGRDRHKWEDYKWDECAEATGAAAE